MKKIGLDLQDGKPAITRGLIWFHLPNGDTELRYGTNIKILKQGFRALLQKAEMFGTEVIEDNELRRKHIGKMRGAIIKPKKEEEPS